ncbi:Putative teichuronic acid biosynthesis glycosyltransferase TuaC [Caulifigura coniformis]|uniref:Teichuronic acid biosynthesis glycosyltransferase TuaC n=1 Tax=Caulifigura coniformis TaxID=2527983 RepID=A0A517SGZ8_9PLAN|nr:glycosyltransferase [Caulifigura coniformis]QDT55392.1 Putative teichuronic acid biosynthesis glycosyltransferase TuaC [Caulifigura coniformis]
MNLLFLSMTFPDAVNRARGSYNLAMCRALAKEHCVQVCSPRPWPEMVRAKMRGKSFEPGPDVQDAGLTASYPCYWYLPKVTQKQSGRLLWQCSRRTVETLAKRSKPDVVLSYWAHPDGEAGLRAARSTGAAAAVIVGGTDALILPHRPGRGPYVRRVLTESETVLTVSEGLRNAVLDLGASPERVHVMYQGVDPDVFHPGDQRAARGSLSLPSSRPVLLWVGRMVEIKRLDLLLDACRLLRLSDVDFDLYLVGSGELRETTEARIQQLGLADAVHCVGAVPYQQTAQWYRAADLTVMCSDSEGLPNVLRESLACGTPFVSTDVGSIREIADSSYAILTRKGDAGELAEAIGAALRGQLRQAAQRYQARSWDDCAAEVTRILGRSTGTAQAAYQLEAVG